jgi:hypothetical protein
MITLSVSKWMDKEDVYYNSQKEAQKRVRGSSARVLRHISEEDYYFVLRAVFPSLIFTFETIPLPQCLFMSILLT